ncbi:MAG TPA: ATP-dependent DNA helicase RecG, partial [Acidothermaceae bacterium]
MPGFDTPLRTVVGGATAKGLAELELHTVGDLLRHYPRRYAQRGELTKLSDLQEGEHVTVYARVASITTKKIRPKLIKTDVRITDDVESLSLTFFN